MINFLLITFVSGLASASDVGVTGVAMADVALDEPLAVADDDDDFFSKTTPADQKGANAGIPSSDSFHDDEEIDIAVTAPPTAKGENSGIGGFDGALTTLSPGKLPLDTSRATLLGDNWGPTIAFSAESAVVVDMPVLYAKSKAEFDGVAYWLVAEAYADGKKVGESRVNVTREAIADLGASVHFFRLYVPVAAKSGMVELKVGKASGTATKAEPLFTRSVKYTLG